MTALQEAKRRPNPPPVAIQPRDIEVFRFIYKMEHVVSGYQLLRVGFWNSEGTMRNRMDALFHNGYLGKPNRGWRMLYDFSFYWLAGKAMEYVTSDPKPRYRKKPRYSDIEHDISLGDFRLDLQEALKANEHITQKKWYNSQFFHHNTKGEVFDVPQIGRLRKRGRYEPDGLGVYRFTDASQTRTFGSGILLEFDNGTMDYQKLLGKALAAYAYLTQTPYYTKRAKGLRAGMIVFVFQTGQRDHSLNRLLQFKSVIEGSFKGDAHNFYFGAREYLNPESILNHPVWYRGGVEEPVQLFAV